MTRNIKLLDTFRSNLTPIENHLVDGYLYGRVGRREFLRHGSLLGLSLPFLGRVALAAGFGATPSMARAGDQPGATIRVALQAPTGAINPLTNGDEGGIVMAQQVAEFLCIDGTDRVVRPCLATSWKPNQDGTVWTFTLRKGVKFHSGAEMRADDVVATFDRVVDPQSGSNARMVFKGVLQKGATRKVDDYTIEFHLDSPSGNFPYLVSSANYNAVILPASYAGGFEKTWDGTGPFRIEKYTQKVGANFVRNDDYWGSKSLPARTEFIFFTDIQPQILALQAGQVDIINSLPAVSGVALLSDPNVDILSVNSAAHQLVHLRCDVEPFKDPRVRRAVALCLDREKLVKGLMKGRAMVGNDSPFAPVYPSTDPTVPQRKRDVAQAKELMKAAGLENGVQLTLTTMQYLEIPEYAQLIQGWVKEIGVDLKLKIMDWTSYVGDAALGKSPWLDATMGITPWYHRGVPNYYFTAALMSDSPYNAAHFKSEQFDTLTKSYFATLDLEAQRAVAGKIERLLLDETPNLYGYFYNNLTAVKKGVVGVESNAMHQLFLQNAGKA
ncbi:ABC transporter substrate-binding protein [Bradyrhizobium iriomotense]|uniref:Peptide ABC transporter substrate-binding protein n=1 Tax=Bradyrhizobium iriomotense TaxID=441950 RepID=A0ABQ6BE80_9BRAD|nr:ABC transporter substrate-binding protein [Bradyrhizobium iriomotense]GLR92156.1 peptide ABC transporter substrate-binding protein [Bradyrhizobium iriomotense]